MAYSFISNRRLIFSLVVLSGALAQTSKGAAADQDQGESVADDQISNEQDSGEGPDAGNNEQTNSDDQGQQFILSVSSLWGHSELHDSLYSRSPLNAKPTSEGGQIAVSAPSPIEGGRVELAASLVTLHDSSVLQDYSDASKFSLTSYDVSIAHFFSTVNPDKFGGFSLLVGPGIGLATRPSINFDAPTFPPTMTPDTFNLYYAKLAARLSRLWQAGEGQVHTQADAVVIGNFNKTYQASALQLGGRVGYQFKSNVEVFGGATEEWFYYHDPVERNRSLGYQATVGVGYGW